MRADMNISAVGLTGTGTQWIDLRDGRFAESASLGPLSTPARMATLASTG